MSQKEQCSFRIDSDVLRRVRNAVHHNRGAPKFLTLDGFVEQSLERAARRLEQENGGDEYAAPKRKTASR